MHGVSALEEKSNFNKNMGGFGGLLMMMDAQDP
jgi:hypothetical protein